MLECKWGQWTKHHWGQKEMKKVHSKDRTMVLTVECWKQFWCSASKAPWAFQSSVLGSRCIENLSVEVSDWSDGGSSLEAHLKNNSDWTSRVHWSDVPNWRSFRHSRVLLKLPSTWQHKLGNWKPSWYPFAIIWILEFLFWVHIRFFKLMYSCSSSSTSGAEPSVPGALYTKVDQIAPFIWCLQLTSALDKFEPYKVHSINPSVTRGKLL